MPTGPFTYTKSPVATDSLQAEIMASAITVALDGGPTVLGTDQLTIAFKLAISEGEKTILDAIVAAHTGVALAYPPEEIVVRRDNAVYGFHDLLRPSNQSRNMNVNGSVGPPINFEFNPAVGHTWEVERLCFGMDDVGLTDFGLFGGVAAMANGILISVQSGGVLHTIGTIKDNADVAMMFPGIVVASSGILDSADGMYGSITFAQQIKIESATGDFVRMSVRDNLTAINVLRAKVVARRVI